ncbi:MAG: hypothetical protein VW804_05875 [Verrucomicrobiota bacterium]
MALHDDHDFVDREFEQSRPASAPPSGAQDAASGLSAQEVKGSAREQLDAKFGSTQQRLLALKQEQEKLESERIALEEMRRRRSEYSQGREEMITHLTRGMALLEEAEEDARREATAMQQSLEDFRQHLEKVSALNEADWEEAQLQRELTHALITIENARKEWLSSVSRFPVLSSDPPDASSTTGAKTGNRSFGTGLSMSNLSLSQMARLGLALTWPLALVWLMTCLVLIAIWSRLAS